MISKISWVFSTKAMIEKLTFLLKKSMVGLSWIVLHWWFLWGSWKKATWITSSKKSFKNHLNLIKIRKLIIFWVLLLMIAFNIGQVSYLVAKLHKIDRVYFAGNFIRNHEETMDCINYAFDFFAQKDEDKKMAVFLTHDGYLGALGSLLVSQDNLWV